MLLYLNMWQCLWNWTAGRVWRNVGEHDIKSLNCSEQIVGTNTFVDDTMGEEPEGNNKQYWKLKDRKPFIGDNSAKLCAAIRWKAKLISDTLGYAAKEISKRSV